MHSVFSLKILVVVEITSTTNYYIANCPNIEVILFGTYLGGYLKLFEGMLPLFDVHYFT